jgi:nicotinamide-nucleotide amidase
MKTLALLEAARARSLKIATAESCTGGLISATLTEVPGSSDVFERGFVTYSNQAKTEMLGVPQEFLDVTGVGAVSEEVARAMAEGAIRNSQADLSVAVTGIAGPGGGSKDKPVGLVHLATARRDGPVRHERRVFSGDRREVRAATLKRAIEFLLESVDSAGLPPFNFLD